MNRQQRRTQVLKTERFEPDEIIVRPGMRALDQKAVNALVESITAVGLQNLPTVRWGKDADGEDEIVLVAGRHRLAAVTQLGWPMIECAVVTMDDREARLWELAENLHRAELTVQEHAEHLAEWVRLTSEKLGQVAQVSGGRGKEGGVSAAVRELGVERTDVRRANKIAAMAPEAKAEVAADPQLADNQAALLRVAQQPTPAQQLMQIKAERDKAEAQKRNRQTDRDIALVHAQEFADWLMARTDLRELPVVIAWLEGTKAKDVMAALRRQVT